MAQISYGTITVTDITDIDRIQNWYLATDLTDSNQVKPSNLPASGHGAWTQIVSEAQVSSSMPYLWNYEVILGTNNYVINTTDPIMIGMYSEDGAPGKGILRIDEYYLATDSSVQPIEASWREVQANTLDENFSATRKYLWNYQKIYYTEGDPTGDYRNARIIGVYGDTGPAGSSTATVYLYKRSSVALSASDRPTDSLVYSFADARVTPTPISNGWVQSLSELSDGSDPIWVITAIANSANITTTFTQNSWSTPKKLVENGVDGVSIIKVEELYYLQTKPTYAVTYQYTGTIPSGAPDVPASTRHKKDEVVTVAASPTMVSHTFSGWKRNNSVVTSFSMPEENVTLTGSWTAKSSYNVTYQYSGTVPSGAPAVPTRQTHYVGEEVTVEPKPSLNGYVFSGWYRNGQEVSSFIMPSSSVTLTGSWTSAEAPTYNVTYSYTNTPSGAPALPAQASYHEGETVTIAATPTLTGYTFSGWKRNGNVVSTSFVMPGEDVSITGTWTAKTQYTVTYQYTGTIPSGAPAVPSQQTYYSGDTVTVASAPTMSGYTFSGWSRTGTFTINSNVTITGSWTASSVPTYTVTYQYTNAPSGVSPPTQQSYQQGTTITLPTPSSVSGYTFNGWTSSQVTISNNRFTMPAYAVTITGSWTSTSPSSGPTRTFASKTLTSASNTIQFTNLQGEPTSFVVVSQGDLATGASPWKTAVVAFNGTSVYGCYITNTSGQQMTASNTVFSKSYSNGTLTITGSGSNPDVEFQPNEYMLVYSYGGTTSDVQSITQTVGSGATSITFTGLTGEPLYFSCVFEGGYYDAVNSSWGGGYQRVIGVVYDGDSTFGMAMGANAVASSSYWSYTYSNGSLTITSQGTNAGGYFHQATGVDYRLTYIVDNQLRSVNNTKGSIETKGETKSNDEIETKSDEIIEIKGLVLTKGATLRAGATLEPPTAPNSKIENTTDETDAWTLTVPTYEKDGIYYTCLQIYYDNSTIKWSTVSRNQGLTDANATALAALEAATENNNTIELIDGYFDVLETQFSNKTPIGVGIHQNKTEAANAWGYNVFIGANGIKLRYNEADYAAWGRDTNNNNTGIYFYEPPTQSNGVYVTSSLAASLTTNNGLVLSRGGIITGNIGTNNYAYLSSVDHPIGNNGITINDFTPDNNSQKWRQVIGSNFGVLSDGSLYASNINVSGTVTIDNGDVGGCVVIGGKLQIDEASVGDTTIYTALQNKSQVFYADMSEKPALNYRAGDVWYTSVVYSREYYDYTVDTSVDNSKTYYTYDGEEYISVDSPSGNPQEQQYYELYTEEEEGHNSYIATNDGSTYFISSDTTVQSGKIYYILNEDLEYEVVSSPSGNPSTKNYYEFSIKDWLLVGTDDVAMNFKLLEFKNILQSWETVNNYMRVQELQNYSITEDTEVQVNKIYYEENNGTYNIISNPTGNPHTQEYYELSTEMSLEMGKIDSPLLMRLTNESLRFLTTDERGNLSQLATLSGDILYVQKQLSFGNFMLYQRENGHLTIRYRGEEGGN